MALVVDEAGKVEQRRLKIDRAIGDTWLVTEGLGSGDRLIVEGLQRARPGALVRAVPFETGRRTTPPPETTRAAPPPGRPSRGTGRCYRNSFSTARSSPGSLPSSSCSGAVSRIYTLPVSQYPPIAPPSIYIQTFYPGASAETVENSVTQIIEQKMTGLDRMIYLSATSDSSGGSRVELTFAPGTDPDLAWAKVQNKLQLAMASLPEVVQRRGITVGKATRNYLLMVGLISEDGSMDGRDLGDYAQSKLESVLSRVPGVGEVQIFGSQYAMRVWLNPDKLVDYRLTVEDIVSALRSYNVEVSAGQFGQMPAVKGQRLNASIVVHSLLKTPEDFAAIPVRINPDGSIVRIKDVGTDRAGNRFLRCRRLSQR